MVRNQIEANRMLTLSQVALVVVRVLLDVDVRLRLRQRVRVGARRVGVAAVLEQTRAGAGAVVEVGGALLLALLSRLRRARVPDHRGAAVGLDRLRVIGQQARVLRVEGGGRVVGVERGVAALVGRRARVVERLGRGGAETRLGGAELGHALEFPKLEAALNVCARRMLPDGRKLDHRLRVERVVAGRHRRVAADRRVLVMERVVVMVVVVPEVGVLAAHEPAQLRLHFGLQMGHRGGHLLLAADH